MKKTIILLISLILLFTGCSMDSAPSNGEIHVTINGSNSRSITEGVVPSTDIAKITINLQSNGYNNGNYINESEEIKYSGTTITKSFSVPAGSYGILVKSYDSFDREIDTRMNYNVSVTPGEKTECSFSFANESAGISKNQIQISVQTLDHTTDTLRIKLSRINSTEYTDSPILTRDIITNSGSFTEYINSVGEYHNSLDNGYYSVSFFCFDENDNTKEVFLGSMPVRVLDGISYINAVWINNHFMFTPAITSCSTSDASHNDPFAVQLGIMGSKIESCELMCYNDSSWQSQGIMKVSELTSYGEQTVSLQKLTLKADPQNPYYMALKYTIEGDKDEYVYLLGNITVSDTKVVTIQGPDKIAKQVKIENFYNSSTHWYRCQGINDEYYDVKWFIKQQGSDDFVEVYSSNNNALFIRSNTYKDDFSIKAELFFKGTDVLAKETLVKEVKVASDYIDQQSTHLYKYNGVPRLENFSAVPVKVYFKNAAGTTIETDTVASGNIRDYFNFNGYAGTWLSYDIYPIINGQESHSEEHKGEYDNDQFYVDNTTGSSISISISEPINGTYFEGNNYPAITANVPSGYYTSVYVNGKENTYYENGAFICKNGITNGINNISVEYGIREEQSSFSRSEHFMVLYYEKGIPSIEVDQVYQAYVLGDNNAPNDLQLGYKTLMLKQGDTEEQNTYYLFDITYSMPNNAPSLSLGVGNYTIEKDTITLGSVVSMSMENGMKPSPAGDINGTLGIDDDGNSIITIGYDKYVLLNSQIDVPKGAESFEGAWQLKSIVPDNEVLNGVLGMFTQDMLPGIDNMISFDDSEGIAVNLMMEIEGNKLRGFASVDADLSILDGTVSLAESFVPFVNLLATIEINDGIPEVSGLTAPLKLTTTTDGSVLVAYAYLMDGMIVPVPFSRTEEYGAIKMNGKTDGIEMTGGRKELADFAEKAITAYPALEDMIAPMFSAPLGDENPIEMMGIWKSTSTDFEWANESDWCIFKNMMNIWSSADQKFYHISSYNNNGEIVYSISAKDYQWGNLNFSDITQNNDGTVSFRITICREGLPYESGTITLTKVNTSLMDFLLRFEIFFGKWEDVGLKFASDGKLLYMDEKGDEVVVGNWCFGEKGDTIRVTIKPWLLNGMWDEPKDIDISFGAELSYKDGEILILEFIENNVVTPFGIKLNIQ